MAAAVADFKPRGVTAGKIERGERESLTRRARAHRRHPRRSRAPGTAPRRLRGRSRAAPRPRPRQEGRQGRRPAGLQRHPRRGRRHRLRRERDHDHRRRRRDARAAYHQAGLRAGDRRRDSRRRWSAAVVTASRAAVLAPVETRVANEHLRRHMLACEAIMRALAESLRRGPGRLGPRRPRPTTSTARRQSTTSRVTAPKRPSALERSARRLRSSTPSPRTTRRPASRGESRLDVALIVADQLSGLITAATLVRPDHRLDRRRR